MLMIRIVIISLCFKPYLIVYFQQEKTDTFQHETYLFFMALIHALMFIKLEKSYFH